MLCSNGLPPGPPNVSPRPAPIPQLTPIPISPPSPQPSPPPRPPPKPPPPRLLGPLMLAIIDVKSFKEVLTLLHSSRRLSATMLVAEATGVVALSHTTNASLPMKSLAELGEGAGSCLPGLFLLCFAAERAISVGEGGDAQWSSKSRFPKSSLKSSGKGSPMSPTKVSTPMRDCSLGWLCGKRCLEERGGTRAAARGPW